MRATRCHSLGFNVKITALNTVNLNDLSFDENNNFIKIATVIANLRDLGFDEQIILCQNGALPLTPNKRKTPEEDGGLIKSL